MRKRSEIIQNLTAAKLAHTKWVRKAKHLVESLPVKEDMIPIDSTDCKFGQWFYSEGIRFKIDDSFSSILGKIEKEHTELHNLYLKIYKIYFVDTKRKGLSKLLFSSNKNVSFKNMEEAKTHFSLLEKVSENLISNLEQFEKELLKLSHTELDDIL